MFAKYISETAKVHLFSFKTQQFGAVFGADTIDRFMRAT